MEIRPATSGEYATVMSILEASGLAIQDDRVTSALSAGEEGTVIVACEEARVLGALVREGHEVTAIAVRPGRRGQGIGSTLVEAASESLDGDLFAEFDAAAHPFYEHLGFEIEAMDDGRYRGTLHEGFD